MPKGKNSQTQDPLEKIVVLLAATLAKDETSLLAKVRLLGGLGLSTAEIATACSAAENVVRARMTELKKTSKLKKE